MKDFTKTQKEDYEWFKENLNVLLKKHKYKHILIYKKAIQGTFDKFEDAVMFAVKEKKYKMGDFIIQEVVSKEDVVNFINIPVRQIIL